VEISVVWIYWPLKFTDNAVLDGRRWWGPGRRAAEPLRAVVDQRSGGPPGVYECLWSVDRHGVSSRLQVKPSP
jgi:hypothetical protein